ncbi:MAG TPA: hypothetical protein PLB89_04840 [Flavobacteriales bacterium]|nr:hypothetical protein [Flavobacteriales bacterium]
MKYSFHQLLQRKPDGGVSGPMSPVLFAQEMAKHMEHPPFNLVVRVRFDDERCFQQLESDGWTGYDTLLLGIVGTKHAYIGLWIDTGLGGVAVAMQELDDAGATFTPIYGEHRTKRDHFFPDDAVIVQVLKEALERRAEFAMTA